jgi:hypothetical protein
MLRLLIAAIAGLVVLSAAIVQTTRLPLIIAPPVEGANTPTGTPTITPTGSATPTGTLTPTPTETSFSTFTSTPTSTPTNTGTATNTPTATGTGTVTPTPSVTPTPTSTETATATGTATATSTSTATEVVPVITILDNHTAYTDSIEVLHVVGEARNDTFGNAEFVKVTANFYNAQNQLVDTEYTYLHIGTLIADDMSCFNIIVTDELQYSYYRFETDYSETSDTPRVITLSNHSGSYNATFEDWYEVIGEARNDSGEDQEFVSIIGTLYDSGGKVIGCDYTYTNADTLTPGQTSTWKITFLHAPPGSVGGYRVQPD